MDLRYSIEFDFNIGNDSSYVVLLGQDGKPLDDAKVVKFEIDGDAKNDDMFGSCEFIAQDRNMSDKVYGFQVILKLREG